MDIEKSSIRAFRNSSYNFISYAWPTVFALFITPIIIFRLGIKNYGIYIFINTIISLLGLLDLGISAAVTKYVSSYYGQGNEKALKTLIHSAHLLFLLTGLAGMLLSLLMFFLGPALLPLKFSLYQQYSYLFLIGGGIFFVNSVVSVYSIIPNAIQRYDISAKIGIASITLSSITILAVVMSGGGLNEIFLAQLILNIIFAFFMKYFSIKILPLATYEFEWDKKEIKKCYIFGSVTFLSNIAGSSLTYLDRLIIPFFIGPSNLTYYSVPGNVTTKIPGVSNNLSAVLFPLTSQLEGEKKTEKIETLYVRSFRLITIISASLTVTCIAFAYPILLYWLDADFADKSSHILILLALTNFMLALSGPLSNFLLGLSKIKFLSVMSIIMAVLNTVLLVILLPIYGIRGAAWAYLLSVLPIAYMFYYTEKKYLTLTGRRGYYIKKLGSTLFTSLLVWGLDSYLLVHFIVNLTTVLIMGAVSVTSYIVIYKFFNFFEKEDWIDIEHFFISVVTKYGLGKMFTQSENH